jgi:hypothetical protein
MPTVTVSHPTWRSAGSERAHEQDWRLLGLSQAQAAAIGLGLIILLGAFLRFYRLGADSIGNLYYAATVRSM